MKVHPYQVRILVKNTPITEYNHEDRVYVEGREGSEFSLELKNNSSSEVLMVPSVDGLSVTDGKPASEQSGGYNLKPYETLIIPGWSLGNEAISKFFFAGKKKSYAALTQDNPDTSNVGVIGVMVFSKKINPFTIGTTYYNPYDNWFDKFGPYTPYSYTETFSPYTLLRSSNNNYLGASCMDTNTSMTVTPTQEKTVDDTYTLGTGFGEKADFKTTSVAFEKDKVEATLVLYYDSRINLVRRGIDMEQHKAVLSVDPNPFPASAGCKPPLGWK